MATKKKAAAKKTAVKKAATKAAPKLKSIGTPYSKTQLVAALVETTGVAKKDVNAVLDEVSNIIHGHIKKRAAGSFTWPGLFKVVTVQKPAQKAKKNVPNPFKPGELMDVPAKPARTVVKVRPLKKMKDMASS